MRIAFLEKYLTTLSSSIKCLKAKTVYSEL